jgi:hypothetical protein
VNYANLFKNQTHTIQLKNNRTLKKTKQAPRKNHIEIKYKLKKIFFKKSLNLKRLKTV